MNRFQLYDLSDKNEFSCQNEMKPTNNTYLVDKKKNNSCATHVVASSRVDWTLITFYKRNKKQKKKKIISVNDI